MGKRKFQISLILIFLNLFSIQAYSQDKEAERFSNRIENIAKEYYRIEDYEKALEGYLMLDSIDPGNTLYKYRIGISYLNSSAKSRAYPYLEFVYQQEDAPEDILFELARAYHLGMEFDKAIIMYESYKKQIQFLNPEDRSNKTNEKETDQYIQQCRNGLEICQGAFYKYFNK